MNAIEAFQILGASIVAETPGTAKVAAGITVEGANEPEQLNEIVEFEEAAQIDSGPEQLNEMFEVKEAPQRDPEYEQLNNGFPESNKKQTLPRFTLYRFTLTLKVLTMTNSIY